MTEHHNFAVFTYEQLKAASKEIFLRNHEMDETNRYILDEGEIFKILCKWTKKIVSPKERKTK